MKLKHFPYLERFKSPTFGLELSNPLIIRVLAATDCVAVYLILTKDGETPVRYTMQKESNSLIENGDFNKLNNLNKTKYSDKNDCLDETEYLVTLSITSTGLYFYRFEVELCCGATLSFGRDEFYEAKKHSPDEWALIVYSLPIPPPTWLKGGIIYQIMTDRFNTYGERLCSKDYAEYRSDQYGIPRYGENGAPITNTDFFGGNLKGITDKLEYLKKLGITAIYLNPIFEARSNHKYDTGNYLKIDPDFGTLDDFKELVNKASALDIGIILDGVFSHTGDDSIYFNKYKNYDSIGAYMSKDSPYYEWYDFSKHPDEYESWWGIKTLPNVYENNKHYTEFICGQEGVLRHWTRMGISGWRLDVVDELYDEFLDNVSKAVKRENSDAVIIGEVWENAATKSAYDKRRRYLLGGQLDSVTNYPLRNAIISFVSGNGADELRSVILETICTYPSHIINNLMNVIGTHDTQRIRTVFGRYENISSREQRAEAINLDPDGSRRMVKVAATLLYTLPGVPCIYYGDEVGLEGFEDPFNRRFFPWNNQDYELLQFFKKLGEIRSKYKHIFTEGKIEIIKAEKNLFVFKRIIENDNIMIAANTSNYAQEFDANEKFDLISDKKYSGFVPPMGIAVLKNRNT